MVAAALANDSLEDTWRLLGECIAPPPEAIASVHGANGETRRLQGPWCALFGDRPRPLLVPMNHLSARRNGMRFFLPDLWRRWYACGRLRAHQLLGERARLPLLTLPQPASPSLLDEFALTESPQVAFLIGTPGPYQKASMLIMSLRGKPLSLTKIALGSKANDMVRTECRWLKSLNAHASLRDFIPQLLREGRTHNGYRFLAQSIVEGRPGVNSFTRSHAEFLRHLGSIDYRVQRFSRTPQLASLCENFDRLAPLIDRERRTQLLTALSDCMLHLGDWRGPFVISHGDFAFWNIRTQSDRICVFDWEYAAGGCSPLFDHFHFHLIVPASSGRPLKHADMRHAIEAARAFALLAYPGFDWNGSVVAAFGLAYLLHTLIFYGLSRGEFVDSHPVVRSYYRLIEERHKWLQ